MSAVGFAVDTRADIVSIKAWSDPQTLGRVINVFALRGLTPDQISCRRAESYLLIDVQLPSDSAGENLLDRIRGMVCVERAELVTGSRR